MRAALPRQHHDQPVSASPNEAKAKLRFCGGTAAFARAARLLRGHAPPLRNASVAVGQQADFSPGMFTGLIEEVGKVLWIRATERGTQLQIAAPKIAEDIHNGDSIAVNGCCLTVKGHRGDQLTFDLLEETLDRTNLRTLRRDAAVNLERALAADSRLGGHFVQGHVDCAARVLAFEPTGPDHRLEVELPADFAHYVAYKGSVALNGISLTVAEVLPGSFAVWIIPHTKRHTNLESLQVGEQLNVEFDLLAKYVERMMTVGKVEN